MVGFVGTERRTFRRSSSTEVEKIESFKAHNVYNVVDDVGQPTISCRWIFTEKERNGEKILKARLVARGFEEVLMERTDSPTCS